MLNKLHILFSVPITIYFNFKVLKFNEAIKFPFYVSSRVRLLSLKGKIKIDGELKRGMIQIGFGNVTIFDKRKSKTQIQLLGSITFKGKAKIGHGSKIAVSGEVIFGDGFVITAESNIVCRKKIVFGNNCVLSWSILIMDTDFHKIYSSLTNDLINPDSEINIGNDVWIGNSCTILKGVSIPDNTVIASNSLVNKDFITMGTILAGIPAKVVKTEIYWKK